MIFWEDMIALLVCLKYYCFMSILNFFLNLMCRGFVMADVLVKDLVVEPSLRVSLKGLKRTRDARVLYWYGPLRWRQKPTLVVMELLGFWWPGANLLCLVLGLLCVVPKPPSGRPFIYIGRRPQFTESRGRIINVSNSVSIPPILQYKLHDNVGLCLQALTHLRALGLHEAPSSFVFLGFK